MISKERYGLIGGKMSVSIQEHDYKKKQAKKVGKRAKESCMQGIEKRVVCMASEGRKISR